MKVLLAKTATDLIGAGHDPMAAARAGDRHPGAARRRLGRLHPARQRRPDRVRLQHAALWPTPTGRKVGRRLSGFEVLDEHRLLSKKETQLRYLTLPGIATPFSRIALGAVSFSPDDYPQAAELLDAFIALGGTCIDTAHVYGRGASERALGRWLRERHNRANVVLIDKGCHPIGESGPRVTPEVIHADLAESLERIQTDSIDLYLLHRDDEHVPVGPLIEALNEECAAGRIRAFGASNWRVERIVEANTYATQRGLAGFVVSSPNLSLARPKEPMWRGCIADGLQIAPGMPPHSSRSWPGHPRRAAS